MTLTIGLIIVIVLLIVVVLVASNQWKKSKTKLSTELNQKNNSLDEKIQETEKLKSDLIRFDGILSIESEIENKNQELVQLVESKNLELSDLKSETQELNTKFVDAKAIFKELKRETKIYQNDLEFIELGIYEPIFDLETSEKYKERITQIVTRQKQLIKGGNACVCDTEWTVGNSRKQGEIMTRRYINLTLRAFNGECDSLISKVRWNNVKRFEERIRKAFIAINKLGNSNNTFITEKYLNLKIQELQLTYEFAHKKYEEKEEARAIREQQREEERSQREFEKARKEAEIEEKRYQKALEQAQKELGLVSGEKLEELNAQIEQLQQNLKEAHEAKERAISRAQETKSGHVYIISNLGSFGENIYKIGMTRRLEPMDRVKELGDASVPFLFDLHAMIFSENAPELEKLLHKEFEDRRINKVNYRKEYFNVSLDEIENVVKEKYEKEVDFVKLQVAQQFRETQSIIQQLEQAKEKQLEKETDKYPDSLF
jgi:hypothetical protein